MPEYERHPPLTEAELDADPLRQLEHWLGQAQHGGLVEPTAMALATADAQGNPAVRMVLFKGMHEDGITFYTDYDSRKGADLAANPKVAAVFWWDRLERQVRIEGTAAKLPREMTERYFAIRPRASQLGAYTSRQSRVVASREILDARLAANDRELAGQPVPCPDHWGGYVVRPRSFEFWQGRRGRLHDRLVYRRDGHGWRIERLEP